MKLIFIVTVLTGSLCFAAEKKSDEFTGLKCGVDPTKSLIGRLTSNERVSVTEARHKDLKLKGLGSSGLAEDPYSLISWIICDQEYAMLIPHQGKDRNHITDVIAFPHHSRLEPEALGPCLVDGKKSADLIAIVKNDSTSKDLPAKNVWLIDVNSFRFKEVPPSGVTCSRTGIVTEDGGI